MSGGEERAMMGVPAMRIICKNCHTEVEMLESDVFSFAENHFCLLCRNLGKP